MLYRIALCMLVCIQPSVVFAQNNQTIDQQAGDICVENNLIPDQYTHTLKVHFDRMARSRGVVGEYQISVEQGYLSPRIPGATIYVGFYDDYHVAATVGHLQFYDNASDGKLDGFRYESDDNWNRSPHMVSQYLFCLLVVSTVLTRQDEIDQQRIALMYPTYE